MKRHLLVALPLLALAAAPASAQTTVSLGLRLGGNYATRAGDDPEYTYNPIISSSATITRNKTQNYSRSGVLAPQFGAVLDVRFGKLALQPALLFSQKGVSQTVDFESVITTSSPFFFTDAFTDNTRFTSRPNYLEIPVNLVFTSWGDHGFQVFGGPYVAFGMGGQVEFESERSLASGNGGVAGGNVTNNSYQYGKSFIYYRNDYPGVPNIPASTPPPNPFQANSGAIVARRFDAGLNLGIGYRRGPLQVQLAYGLGLSNQQPDKGRQLASDLPAYYQRVAQLTATYFVPFRAAPTPAPLP